MRMMCLVPTLLMCSTKALRCATYSSIGTCWRPLQCTGHVTHGKCNCLHGEPPCMRQPFCWRHQMPPR